MATKVRKLKREEEPQEGNAEGEVHEQKPAENTPTQAQKIPIAQKSDENVIAAISYVGIVGIIIYLMYKDKGNKFILFHATQSIMLFIGGFLLGICCAITIVGIILLPFIWLGTFASAILCAIKAYQGERYQLPIIGGRAERHANA
jgi:uncharacterized membrane protein